MSIHKTVWRPLLAQFLGKSGAAIGTLLFLPLYLQILGVEAYALIGFFVLLGLCMAPVDAALTLTISRDLARLAQTQAPGQEHRDVVRTLEIPFWIASLCIGLALSAAAPYFAGQWVQPLHIQTTEVCNAMVLMGIALVLQWPTSLYASGLVGMNKQVRLNLLLLAVTMLRCIGAWGVLVWISPSIQAFFLWQIGVNLLHVGLSALLLWRSLPLGERSARFQKNYLKQSLPLAFGMSVLSILSLLLIHGDKIVISKLTSLENYGYYTIAATLSGGLYFIITPLFSVFFPSLCRSVAATDLDQLRRTYEYGSRLLAILLLPAASILLFFPQQLLMLWTHNPVVSSEAGPILFWLALGTACNGLMNLPYALQLAHGWMRLVLIQNAVSVCLLLPLTIYSFHVYGMKGAALSWLVHNAGCLVLCVPLIHRKFFGSFYLRWFFPNCLIPGITGVLIVGASAILLKQHAWSSLALVSWLILTYLVAVSVSYLMTPTQPLQEVS